MPENKLTDKHLRAAKPLDTEQVLGDGGGLWVRLLPSSKGGAVNFYYRFQIAGKERRYNCGTYPETSLAQARERRNAARNLVRKGIDPVLQENNDRMARAAAQTMESMERTVSELLDDWKRVYLSAHRKDGGKAVEDAMRRDVIPVIGSIKAKDVRLPHIVKVIDRILDRNARRTANQTLSLMRQMFRHGMGRGIVETDPTLALSRKQAGGKETPVQRNLSLSEIEELHTRCEKADLPDRIKAAIWLLLATGARVGELAHAKWEHVDEQEGVWTIPAENSKNGRPHLIHLSPFALKQIAVLKAIKSGDYLLAGRDHRMPISEKTISKAIRDRNRTVPLKKRTPKVGTLILKGGEWTPHDLRRTMASRMGDLGVEPHVIERCLNHIQQGIVGVYQRQEYLAARKAALLEWGNTLSRLTAADGSPELP